MKKPPSLPALVRALADTLAAPAPELLGAAWWYQDLARHGDRLLRSRRLLELSSLGTGLAVAGAGCGPGWAEEDPPERPPAPALEVQQTEGWAVGQEMLPLSFPGASETDAAGNTEWHQTMGD